MQNNNKTLRGRARLLTLVAAITAGTTLATAGLEAVPVAAQSVQSSLKIAGKHFIVNGQQTTLPASVLDGETYIGLRSLNTQLGLTTKWDQQKRVVTVTGRGRSLELSASQGTYWLNGQQVYASIAYSQDGTTYVPLRFVLERFGYAIGYKAAAKSVSIDAIHENELSFSTEKITDTSKGLSLLVQYPQISGFADSAVQSKVNAYLKQQAETHAASGRETLNQAVKDNADIDSGTSGFERLPVVYEGLYTLTYNEQNRLSLYVDYYTDLGGAHGSTVRIPYTFDLKTGELITLQVVTKNNSQYVNLINDAVQKQIKSQHIMMLEPFKTIGPDREYFLKHEGIVVFFQQYEYTPYAAGMPEFTIPLSAF